METATRTAVEDGDLETAGVDLDGGVAVGADVGWSSGAWEAEVSVAARGSRGRGRRRRARGLRIPVWKSGYGAGKGVSAWHMERGVKTS